ncbi:response regulator transcription factor [Adlercreutzia murintestinalis]|uniref:response regulator transcription factor n=1 Tax=Adlercreutzia murintestinalis TaxID=2941325 RepID=UPI00203A8351|nr:winged helix family transcriptional regulator [Adlercreutzia murintestinalis]
MSAKKVIFIADSLENAHRFQQVLSQIDAEVVAGSSAQALALATQHPDCDLVVFEEARAAVSVREQMQTRLAEEGHAALLIVVEPDRVAELHLPVHLRCDFVLSGAEVAECMVRVRHLLWPGSDTAAADMVMVGALTINLATYQVKVGDRPLDLTYLEYALLAFLATHPSRTYSRDALLRQVWGFDYYGGSRTVDVHVRRIRAKLGPDLAHRLQTVRGVGYLWNA